MKKNGMSLEEIIHVYGNVEVYNEEQRRCGLATIQLTQDSDNPYKKQFEATRARTVESFAAKTASRFSLKLFAQRA